MIWYVLTGLILLYTVWCLIRWWKGRKKGCHGGCADCAKRGRCGRK